MPFEKGSSGNPQGRKTGTPNKTTKEMRLIIQTILENYFTKPNVYKDIKQLSPKHRIEVMIKMMEFAIPKLKSENTDDSENNSQFDFEKIKADMTERLRKFNDQKTNLIYSAPDSAPK